MFYRLITFIRRWLIIRREKLVQHEFIERYGRSAPYMDPDWRPDQYDADAPVLPGWKEFYRG